MNTINPTTEDQLLSDSTVSNFFSPETKLLANRLGDLDYNAYSKNLSDRIFILERELIALKTCQNAIVPINRLPPEILSQIFHHVQDLDEGDGSSLRVVFWVFITGICKHWRAVALNCNTLWAYLAFPHPKFTELMLSRSGSAPLRIEFDYESYTRFVDVLRKALSQVERLHAVYISSGNSLLEDILPVSFASAPVMESLTIDSSELDLPSALFDGGLPRLERLYLRGCRLSWTAIPFSATMTHLTLGGESLVEGGRPSVQGFIDALKQMPRLHNLTLFRYLPPHSTGQASLSSSFAPSQLKLDSLRRLELEEDTEAKLIGFFNLIQVPNVQSMHLRLVKWEVDESFRCFMRLLWSSWRNGGRSREGRPRVKEIGAAQYESTRISFLDGDIAKELNLRFQTYVGIPLYRFFMITSEFDFDDIQILSLCNVRVNHGRLVSMFGQYRNLQTVDLINNEAFTVPDLLQFLRSIGHPLPENAEGDGPQLRRTAPVQFPGIVSISCAGLHFGGGEERKRIVTALADALRERSKSSTLRQLRLARCWGLTEREYLWLCEPPIPGLEVSWDGIGVR
ncbi:hypothetical protein NMY22_g10119 [Coprinellus aureogranulatus]|nr:hypothetical protein NMY22_g10119 [Coprinellus aureogranulatus]